MISPRYVSEFERRWVAQQSQIAALAAQAMPIEAGGVASPPMLDRSTAKPL